MGTPILASISLLRGMLRRVGRSSFGLAFLWSTTLYGYMDLYTLLPSESTTSTMSRHMSSCSTRGSLSDPVRTRGLVGLLGFGVFCVFGVLELLLLVLVSDPSGILEGTVVGLLIFLLELRFELLFDSWFVVD